MARSKKDDDLEGWLPAALKDSNLVNLRGQPLRREDLEEAAEAVKSWTGAVQSWGKEGPVPIFSGPYRAPDRRPTPDVERIAALERRCDRAEARLRRLGGLTVSLVLGMLVFCLSWIVRCLIAN